MSQYICNIASISMVKCVVEEVIDGEHVLIGGLSPVDHCLR